MNLKNSSKIQLQYLFLELPKQIPNCGFVLFIRGALLHQVVAITFNKVRQIPQSLNQDDHQ